MLRSLLDFFSRAAAVVLGLAFACAWAQAPQKPGPMQSGRHASEAAAKEAATGVTQRAPAGAPAKFDANQLFATSCGWCHLNGGRQDGKGPKLMGTPRTDAELVARIRTGKPGQMPAFGATFSDEQMKAIVAYIRGLKP